MSDNPAAGSTEPPGTSLPLRSGTLEVPELGTLEFVARGGTSTVYRTGRRDGTDVALKVLDDAHRAQREVDVAAKLASVSEVLPVVAQGELVDGRRWVATPFADLGTAEDLRRAGPLPVELVVRIANDAAAALAGAHALGVVHADVKPSNLFVAADGSVRLGDFGASHEHVDADDPATVGITLLYCAPETLEGSRPRPASDVYSFGLTLWALLTGKAPFDDRIDDGLAGLVNAAAAGHRSDLPDDVPAWLRDVVQRCTALRPEDRFPSGAALRDALRNKSAGSPHRRPRAAAWTTALAATAVVLALAGGAAVWRAQQRTPSPAPSGATAWQRQLSSGAGSTPGGYDSSAAVLPDHRLVVAHTDLDRGRLLLTTCSTVDCSRWSTRTVDPGPGTGYYPSVKVADGKPVIAYQDSRSGALRVRTCGDPQCRQSRARSAPLPPGLSATIRARFASRRPAPLDRNLGLVPRLVLDDGVPVVAFAAVGDKPPGADTPASSVWLDRCSDSSCRSWTSNKVADGAVPSLALGPGGRPVVAGSALILENLSFGNLWIAACADPACNRSSVTATSVAVSTPSVTVHDDGSVTAVGMSYSAATEPDGIWVVACAASCPTTTVSSSKVAERSQPDGYPTVSTDGSHPVLAFRSRNEDLPGISLLRCAAPDCAAAGTPVPANSLVPEAERILGGGDDPFSVVADRAVTVSSSRFPADTKGAKLMLTQVPLGQLPLSGRARN